MESHYRKATSLYSVTLLKMISKQALSKDGNNSPEVFYKSVLVEKHPCRSLFSIKLLAGLQFDSEENSNVLIR